MSGTTLMRQPFDTTGLRVTGEPAPVAENLSAIGATGAAYSVSDTGALVYATGQASANRRPIWSHDGMFLSSPGPRGSRMSAL